MEDSCSENDLSISPFQILQRLQLIQKRNLRKHHTQYDQTTEASSTLTEIISHFSNSTSYNTFRSILQSSCGSSSEGSPRIDSNVTTPKVNDQDLIEGVSLLNLSQETEYNLTSPKSVKNGTLDTSRQNKEIKLPLKFNSEQKKQISLDEMPILSPKKDFESLVLEKLQNETNKPNCSKKETLQKLQTKKPFLKRGEGMARFGLKKNHIVIENTKSLPWRKAATSSKRVVTQIDSPLNEKAQIQMIADKTDSSPNIPSSHTVNFKIPEVIEKLEQKDMSKNTNHTQIISPKEIERSEVNSRETANKDVPKLKNPLVSKGKTWAAVLSKEQTDFLRQLKQSDYYKNFVSPTKSTASDISYDENVIRLTQEKERVDQKMFELLENKVTNESFNLENSFVSKFLRKRQFESSGESTPLIMQKCLTEKPQLTHLSQNLNQAKSYEISQTEDGTCHSEYTECCSDTCSSVSSCCSCKTVETIDNSHLKCTVENDTNPKRLIHKKEKQNMIENTTNRNNTKQNKQSQDDILFENEELKANMAEMNAKVIKTSELLKDRLSKLEDEIEIFKNENSKLLKLREEVDLERQRFYEEKATYEQKINEDKILSEYHLAEEKERLNKQKTMYEKYVREMKGRLIKKDKDEVVNLKKEISDLKEEIRIKDAKSTATIARLRNHVKIIEKEKNDLQNAVARLEKENRRIRHSNEVTRRLTNMKYLEQINKKLNNMTSKETKSEIVLDADVKYKAFEIERQSRNKKILPVNSSNMRPRAKSVPNLNVTSRYAKYFSQRDVVSQMEQSKISNFKKEDIISHLSDDEISNNDSQIELDCEEENQLEKIYLERFQTTSPTKSKRSSSPSSDIECVSAHMSNKADSSEGYFIDKNSSGSFSRNTLSPKHIEYAHNSSGIQSKRSKSPNSIISNTAQKTLINSNSRMSKFATHTDNLSSGSNSHNKSKSSISAMSHQHSGTVINVNQYRENLALSPEPTTSTADVTRTNLNPMEIRKSDGTRELRFPNGNVKYISPDGKYTKFVYYNGDVKENYHDEGRIKYFYAETKTFHTTQGDGLEILEFPDGQVEKRYKDGSSEIRLPNGSVRYYDPKNQHVREEWRFPDGTTLTIAVDGEQRIVFNNGQVEVHAKDHKRREFPDGTVKLVYNDGTAETRYASGRVRIKDKHGNLIMDSACAR